MLSKRHAAALRGRVAGKKAVWAAWCESVRPLGRETQAFEVTGGPTCHVMSPLRDTGPTGCREVPLQAVFVDNACNGSSRPRSCRAWSTSSVLKGRHERPFAQVWEESAPERG